MRISAILSLFALLFCFATFEASAFDSYPYIAQVAVPQAVVRSGPEKSYYATSELKLGDQIEVYYETEDWCAIRPPKGSFSWISAVYVELDLSNHIGTVVADGLASRIGSNNTELCETVQVKLKKGEKVLVLDQLETPENAASPLWYKIAPPSGEFRWVHRSALKNAPSRYEPQKLTAAARNPVNVLPESGLRQRTATQKSAQDIQQVLYQIEQEAAATLPAKTPPPAYPSVFDGPALGNAVTETMTETKESVKTTLAATDAKIAQPANQTAENMDQSAQQLQEALKNSAQELSASAQKLRDDLKASVGELNGEPQVDLNGKVNASQTTAQAKVSNLPPLAEKLASARPDPRFDRPLYGNTAPDNVSIPANSNNAPTPGPVHAVDPFQAAFEELKEETRVVLTRPTEDWVFETLIHRGNELYEIAPTDNDLEKIYHLVATLERTRAVRQEISYRRQFRTGGLLTPPPSAQPQPAQAAESYAANRAAGPANRSLNNTAGNTSQIPANIPHSRVATASTSPSDIASAVIPPRDNASQRTVTEVPKTGSASSFDVIGMLGEFDPLPVGHPPYAVVNEKKEIICLITPATGLDLKPHVGQTVGINGMIGIYRKPGKPDARHVTAQGVWPQ